jgi:hypothetical protein
MELFSKRNEGRTMRRIGLRHYSHPEEPGKFISDSLRTRLKEQIKYMIRSKVYLERFMYVENKQSGETYLHNSTLSDLSMREAGYDLDTIVDFKSLAYKAEEYQDAKLFDLIELVIIFSKPEKRAELISRLGDILREEGEEFSIHGFMIVSREHDGLRSIVPLIKERNLREKLAEYYQQRVVALSNYEVLAQISADIIQLLFSSPKSRKNTKNFSLDLCTQVASKWTEKAKIKELTDLFSETVKNAKELSNQIQNVRHTDRTTIPIEAPNFYKLIAAKNINIIELVILSLPEIFISSQDPENIKISYLKRYEINKESGWVVKEKEPVSPGNSDDFDSNNIPF